jgi:hypothetical protein
MAWYSPHVAAGRCPQLALSFEKRVDFSIDYNM